MEEVIAERDSYLTGVFETDYIEACKRHSVQNAPPLHKIQWPLPPLTPVIEILSSPLLKAPANFVQIPSTAQLATTRENMVSTVAESIHPNSGGPIISKTPSTDLLPALEEVLHDNAVVQVDRRMSAIPTSTENAPIITHQYKSAYKLHSRILVELAENEYEEEVFKVEVRGWKLSLKVMEALTTVMPACTSITTLVYAIFN
jgi:hypothetical protein